MARPSKFILQEHLQELWEKRAGRALRRIGLRSVRTTILTLAVIATLIPVLATSWISYRQNSRAIEAKLNEQLSAASAQSSREVGLWLKERLYDLRVFAASYEVTENLERGGGASRRLPDYLSSVNDRFPDYDELMVVAPDLRVVASSERTPGRLHLSGSWMQAARQGDPVLGEPQRADSATPVSMEVAVPIVGVTGRFLGVLAARLNFNAIEDPLRELVPGGDGRVIFVRSDGHTIVAIGTKFEAIPEATLRDLAQGAGASVAYDAPDGVAVIGVMADVPRTEWKIVAEVPQGTAYADIRRVRNTTIILVLVLLGAVGTLAYALGLLIVLPLERLSHAARSVAGGDLDVDVPTTAGGGEVSELSAVFNDMVRRLRDGRAELERLSVTDELTGLANRRQLTTELAREVQRSDRHGHLFAVLMLDVDKFKHFNDTHGHLAGDTVLKRLARIMLESAREVDTVARYGGEEFLMILPETDHAGAALMAERVRASTEAHRVALESGTEVSVTVSIGFAVFPTHARTPDAMIEAADQALYRSKEAGRNRVTAAAPPTEPTLPAPGPRARKQKG